MARTLAAENEGWFDVNQYDNLDNPEGHYRTLGPEIWMQTNGKVTHFVAGGSTGGTISGTGRFLKSMNPDVKAILADPHGSIFCDFIQTVSSNELMHVLVKWRETDNPARLYMLSLPIHELSGPSQPYVNHKVYY